ncbi:MAG: DNA repair protein RecN [Verrucomicrobiota bacterium]
MLQSLHIKNLATVEHLQVDFADGVNVLTGETGAGKSVILGAVEMVLGARADKSSIRQDSKECEVTAIFKLPTNKNLGQLPEQIDNLLAARGIDTCEDGQLLITRSITPSGGRAFINACPTTLKVLKELGDLLVDIHGPNDHQSLLNTTCQRSLLDTYGKHHDLLATCRQVYNKNKKLEAQLEELETQNLSPAEAELLEHQVNEIEQADLRAEEEDDIAARYRIASHAQRLLEITDQCRHGLTEIDGSITDQMGNFVKLLSEAAEIDPSEAGKLLQRLEDIVAQIQDLSDDIGNLEDNLELDETELQQLSERLDLIQRLKRKHNTDISGLNQKAAEMREKLDRLQRQDQLIQEVKDQLRAGKEELQKACDELSSHRRKAADKLAEAISRVLRKLGFAQADFEIRLTDKDLGPEGSDTAEFRFAPNPGEAMQPLRKIASSGEISRVMLAVKTVLSEADQVPVLIFDEVDANIGGRVATQVAEQLSALGQNHQILCITHLAQIAASAHRHYEVGKQIENNRTMTTITRLDIDGRVTELSRMLGASAGSSTARDHAHEMLEKQGLI